MWRYVVKQPPILGLGCGNIITSLSRVEVQLIKRLAEPLLRLVLLGIALSCWLRFGFDHAP